ncbi:MULTISPECIES: helix-turn-helix domain-containing protein [unclassified Synechococcus]|uniref:helix-turn-helix domain-containing protein n=1 Tax=unclassified Synechococcus TaxID=2626047 RepID=UPI0012E93641|nr:MULTISPECIES: helix-turn-helix domain-containing protein [unclassified Synechococcus]
MIQSGQSPACTTQNHGKVVSKNTLHKHACTVITTENEGAERYSVPVTVMTQAEKNQATLVTSVITLKKSSQHRIITNESENRSFQLNIIEGFIRLYCVNECQSNTTESTLALIDAGTSSSFYWNNQRRLMIEALEPSKVEFNPKGQPVDTNNFLENWILDLYEIKQPADSLERLIKLLLLLARTRGNQDSAADQSLISGLSHRRIGEIISSTRPTISRHLGWMQRQNLIDVDVATKTMRLNLLQLQAKQDELFAQPRPHLH